MATRRNPSWNLTDARLDDIVDQLLLHRYSKRPPSVIDVVRTGFINGEGIRAYVETRWPERSRYAATIKGVNLSGAGQTMRSNKLAEHVRKRIGNHNQIASNELVWSVRNSRTYDVICYASGTYEGARNWAFTLFGWTLREGIRIEELRTELAGCGGDLAASIANISMLGRLNDQIEEYENRAAASLLAAEKYRLVHSTISSAAAHLAGGTGATDG
jgi:hypothetical protein